MKYVYLKGNVAYEVIPEVNPVFPDIPISQRYTAEFLSKCIAVEDSVPVESGWTYDIESGKFYPPVQPEPIIESEPTDEQEVEAQPVVSTED